MFNNFIQVINCFFIYGINFSDANANSNDLNRVCVFKKCKQWTKHMENILFCIVFFFLFIIIHKWKIYFINYKLQKKGLILPPMLSVPLFTENQLFCLVLPCLALYPPPPHSKTELDKVSNSFGLQNIFNLLPFSSYILCFFHCLLNFFLSFFNLRDFCN